MQQSSLRWDHLRLHAETCIWMANMKGLIDFCCTSELRWYWALGCLNCSLILKMLQVHYPKPKRTLWSLKLASCCFRNRRFIGGINVRILKEDSTAYKLMVTDGRLFQFWETVLLRHLTLTRDSIFDFELCLKPQIPPSLRGESITSQGLTDCFCVCTITQHFFSNDDLIHFPTKGFP